ncbi:MAG TPA: 16S rRNA (cytosine(967)-C(5))-methyltransferase RsmB [Candidatus Binatia bacterium]|nr:16S rRNA (cytosine(967)-C(5))-methyltransferase RsmB [Candidatus Binatia bacterium]
MPRGAVAPPGADPRAIAHAVLVRVETTEAFADALLARRLADAALAPPDQALATRLVYGTLAWQGRLDHHLARLVHAPLASLDPPVRAALRLGLYQLLFLDRVPAHAAVDASVRLAGRRRGAAGLVNAVLRRAARAGRAGLGLPPRRDLLERLAVEWSHPRWLVERWAAEFGVEPLAALLAADNEPGSVAVRANPARTTRAALAGELASAGVETVPCRFAPDALLIARGAARVRDLAAYREGRVAFQGEASQLVVRLLEVGPGARVLDACAAPGGKATYAAALGATVVALDQNVAGLRRLRAEALRLGVTGAHPVVGDARRPPAAAAFDAVLVDAPCSGLGTLRRHPELRWRRRPEDVARLAALQRDLLDGVAALVRPGGTLVYAVCTLAREENADLIAIFLARHPEFVVEPATGHLPAAAAVAVTAEGFLRTLPSRDGLDGFFAARLRRGR